jgi:hypothetical protein
MPELVTGIAWDSSVTQYVALPSGSFSSKVTLLPVGVLQ